MNSISFLANRVEKVIPQEDRVSRAKFQEPQIIEPVSKSKSSWTIWQVIFFLPNLLLVKPVLYCWYVFTFPLIFFESSRGNKQVPARSQSRPAAARHQARLSNTCTPSQRALNDIEEDELVQMQMELADSPTPQTQTQPKFLFPKKLIPYSSYTTRKTLVLDLDETLIHSLSRGSFKMSNSHMVEVKFKESQVSTLYYVHKRPYCDLFLSSVSQWFDLVIFTASLKEYADPVIDWLESERKYFKRRMYRNDCILRDGAGYIKDLTQCGKLQDTLIIDNSPISYAMHVENAIHVEGWINDPSDTDLLNLIPLLQGLRYSTDVRAVLGLKSGGASF